MRVVDLDRDMRDVIPTGTSRDSEYLFRRMTDRTLELARPWRGHRVLDVASGFGQDAIAMAAEGAFTVGAEPSGRMTALAAMQRERAEGPLPYWVRAWSDTLPFADESFDGVICKGAIDHFDRSTAAIAEMARVTRRDGRVVLAIANFESFSCRAARASDCLREDWLGRSAPRGRRHYDVPSDHFTRYELALMREQMSRHVDLDVVEGISLAWGLPLWTRSLGRLPEPVAQGALVALDWLARRMPALSDVVVLAGRPRSASTSA